MFTAPCAQCRYLGLLLFSVLLTLMHSRFALHIFHLESLLNLVLIIRTVTINHVYYFLSSMCYHHIDLLFVMRELIAIYEYITGILYEVMVVYLLSFFYCSSGSSEMYKMTNMLTFNDLI